MQLVVYVARWRFTMPAFDPSCIDVEDFLDCLAVRNVQRATEREFRFSCPYPEHATGDQTPSGYMNAETTAFFCQSCHARGNAVTFTADVLGVSPIEATRMLKQRYSKAGIDPDARNMVEEIRKIRERAKKTERRTNRIIPDTVLVNYRVEWWQEKIYVDANMGADWACYMFDRGFTVESLMEWEFGFSMTHDRITLPVRDEHSYLVGIKARSYNWRKPKYLNLRDKENDIEPYLKNDVVFGLDRARKLASDLIVVEGEYNVVAMHSYGHRNTVAINGSFFGERQLRLLKRYADSLTLFFDSDAAGRDATKALSDALRPFLPIYVCPDHHGDPAEMHPNSVAACLEDRQSLTRRAVLLRS